MQKIEHFNERLVTLNDVKELTGFGKSFIYKSMEEGTFPKQYHFGKRAEIGRAHV